MLAQYAKAKPAWIDPIAIQAAALRLPLGMVVNSPSWSLRKCSRKREHRKRLRFDAPARPSCTSRESCPASPRSSACSASLYFLTAATTVEGADNGEFCTLFATGGVAHPSGYPLYTLLLRAFAWMPASTPAHGAALVTAGIGLAAVALLYFACRAWGAEPWAAALGATVFGVSPIAWDLATQAEVFSLNAALAAAIVLLAAPLGPAKGRSRVLWLGLLAGLGLSNHHTIVLLAPLGIWAFVRGVRESTETGTSALRTLALGVGALLLGLLPYASLPFAARGDLTTRWVWGDVTTLGGIFDHLRRADYGTTELALHGAPFRPMLQMAALARRLLVDLRVVPCLVGVGFLAIAGTRSAAVKGTPHRFAIASLGAAFLLAGPVFASATNIEAISNGRGDRPKVPSVTGAAAVCSASRSALTSFSGRRGRSCAPGLSRRPSSAASGWGSRRSPKSGDQ